MDKNKKLFYTIIGAISALAAATAATALFTLALHSSIFSESSYIVRKKSIKSLSKFIFIPTNFLFNDHVQENVFKNTCTYLISFYYFL